MSKIDLEILLNSTINLAKAELEKNGALAPFGTSLKMGKIGLHMSLPESAGDTTTDVVESLKEGLQKLGSDSQVVAISLCLDVKFSKPASQDAIVFQLEDREGLSIVAKLPYVQTDQGKIDFCEMEYSAGLKQFFS